MKTEIQELKNSFDLFVILVFIVVLLFFAAGVYVGTLLQQDLDKQKRKRKLKFPACRCSDVNQCDVWCIGKENFSKQHP